MNLQKISSTQTNDGDDNLLARPTLVLLTAECSLWPVEVLDVRTTRQSLDISI